MTVYALMPVFNRHLDTETMINCLLGQYLVDENIVPVVIDDGSTDDTSKILSAYSNIISYKGTGDLWWGGCIDLAINKIQKIANNSDWILFVNDDSWIESDFVQTLLNCAKKNYPAAVGSVIKNIACKDQYLSIGASIDPLYFVVNDLKSDLNINILLNKEFFSSDVLSGRGALYPLKYIIKAKGMRPQFFPHYFADYDLSVRVKRIGCKLITNIDSIVYSENDFGSKVVIENKFQKYFCKSSPSYWLAVITFWWTYGGFLMKCSIPFRALFFILFPGIRAQHKS